MGSILGREPVLWLALIQALLACGIGFGLKVTTEQMALLLTATGAILAFVARGAVTPQAPQTVNDVKTYLEKATPDVLDKARVTMPGLSAPPAKPSGYGGSGTLGVLIAMALLVAIGCGTAEAQPRRVRIAPGTGVATSEPDSSMFAWWRLSGVVGAQAAQLENAQGETFTAFLPRAGLSYSWTADLSTVAYLEGDAATLAGWGAAGVRLRTYKSAGDNPLSMYLGADYVWPNDKARERLGYQRTRHTELSVRVATPVARREDGSTLLFAIGSSRWSPDERIVIDGLPRRRGAEYALGVQWQGFGGR